MDNTENKKSIIGGIDDDFDPNFNPNSLNEKRAEIEALVRIHGYTLERSCELAGLEMEKYLKEKPIGKQSVIKYLPTPDQIERECERLRRSRPEEGFFID